MIEVIHRAGFHGARASRFFDCFSGTTKERVARKFQVRGANFIAHK